jgi:hypothetical protein
VADDREADASHRGRSQRAVVEIRPLDQKIRRPRCLTNVANLTPQTPVHDRKMEAAGRLSLNEHTVRQCVVGNWKPFDAYIDAAFCERVRDTAGLLPRVRRDSAHWLHAARQSVRG